MKRAALIMLFASVWVFNNAQTLILGTAASPQSGCAMTIYDNGGVNGNYIANRNDLLTIHSNSTDSLQSAVQVTINLSRFNVHPSDTLFIYDGPNVADTTLLAALNDNLVAQYGTSVISFAATMRNPSGDLTIRFKTDGANGGRGFEINTSCTRFCQRINIAFDTLLSNKYPVLQDDGYYYIDVCPGDSVHLVAHGVYPDNYVNYAQSDPACTFVWDLGVETFDSLGMNTLDYTFPEGRGYDVSLLIKDQRACESANRSTFRVRTSSNPIRTIVAYPDVCLGDTIDMTYGYDESSHIQIDTIAHEQMTTLAVSDTIFLPDGIPCNGTCSYLSPVTFTAFSPNARITSVNDIFYVRLSIEHSYIGDIWIRLICPNGQYSSLMKWSGSGSAQCSSQIPQSARGWNASGNRYAYFGNYYEPDGSDKCSRSQNPMGTCWNYCWSNNTTQGYSYACGNSYVYENCNHINNYYVDSTNTRLMTNVYHPDDNFYTSLQNCPLNGTWSIEVMDGWSADNGYVCGWELALNPALVPQDWSYDVTVDTVFLIGLGSEGNIAVPTQYGALNYTARVTDNLNCQYDTTMSIMVNQPQENEFSQTVCDMFVWNGIEYTQSGDYIQTLTTHKGCDSVVTMHLTVLQSPQMDIVPNQSICHGDSLVVNFSPTAQDVSFNWTMSGNAFVSGLAGSGSGNISALLQNHTAATQNLDITAIPTYTSGGYACHGNPVTFTVSVLPIPEVTMPTVEECAGKTVELMPEIQNNVEAQPVAYHWSTGDTTESLTVVATASQTYSLTTHFSNGCTATDSMFMEVIPLEQPVITGDAAICAGKTALLQVAAGNSDYLYEWNDGFSGSTRIVSPAVTTEYIVRGHSLTDMDCFAADTFTVVVKPLPDVSFILSADNLMLELGAAELHCTLTCKPDSLWRWNFNDPHNPEILSGPEYENPSHNYTHAGNYPVTLSVTDRNGCTDSLTQYVTVSIPISFWLPNAFTPNGDNLNDHFKPSYESIRPENYRMLIYDKQGHLIFRSFDIEMGWDGNDMQGNPCPHGVYVYYIRYYTIQDHPQGPGHPQLTGNVTLIR